MDYSNQCNKWGNKIGGMNIGETSRYLKDLEENARVGKRMNLEKAMVILLKYVPCNVVVFQILKKYSDLLKISCTEKMVERISQNHYGFDYGSGVSMVEYNNFSFENQSKGFVIIKDILFLKKQNLSNLKIVDLFQKVLDDKTYNRYRSEICYVLMSFSQSFSEKLQIFIAINRDHLKSAVLPDGRNVVVFYHEIYTTFSRKMADPMDLHCGKFVIKARRKSGSYYIVDANSPDAVNSVELITEGLYQCICLN